MWLDVLQLVFLEPQVSVGTFQPLLALSLVDRRASLDDVESVGAVSRNFGTTMAPAEQLRA